jgi:putative nucleotidyltransferase with HDIG domain
MMEKIEEYARVLCAQDEEDPNLFEHVRLVRKYAVQLAHIEGADIRVCEIAALLHDIGKCKGRKNHHITGKKLAEKFLDTVDISTEKKELILKCIEKHRTRFSSEDNKLEVRVIQCADCLGTLFNDVWQEHCRKTRTREDLLHFYEEDVFRKLTLDSARQIALPQLEILKARLDRSWKAEL